VTATKARRWALDRISLGAAVFRERVVVEAAKLQDHSRL